MNALIDQIAEVLRIPAARFGIVLGVALLAALVVRIWVARIMLKLTAWTRSGIDDQVIVALRTPVAVSIVLVAVAWVLNDLGLTGTLAMVLPALVKTIAVFLWGRAALRVGAILLQAMSRNQQRLAWVRPARCRCCRSPGRCW